MRETKGDKGALVRVRVDGGKSGSTCKGEERHREIGEHL